MNLWKLFKLKHVKTVDLAVSMLGKSNIKVLCLSQMNKMMFDTEKWDLSPYNMTHKELKKVSLRRMKLMNLWYKKVDRRKLSILSVTAMIGNFGQFVMARMIKEQDLVNEFQVLIKEKGVYEAELELMHTTSLQITADILHHWNFTQEYILATSESMSFFNTNEDIAQYSFANSVIFSLIEPTNVSGDIVISDTLGEIFKDEQLNINDLRKAVNELEEK